jgi:ribosome biogenesis GTPase
VVGDQVEFVRSTNSSTGAITAILPRKNKLARRSAVPMPGAHAHEQVIIANVDQVVPVFAAANPAPHWNMLDRYLVSAESAGIPAMIVITKSDLSGAPMNGDDLEEIISEYRGIGYRVQMVSAHTREGLDTLHQELAGRSSVFLGKSGVGKTSLLNALQPGLGLRVNTVNQVTGKGKHTTTHLEMFELDARGTTIVDTPGVREFGLWDVEEDDLALYFPEMRPLAVGCKFGRGCRHDEEPGCAVRKGVMNGLISPRRYNSYVRLLEDA